MTDGPLNNHPPSAFSARQMLAELALPAGPLRAEHAALEDGFIAAIDPIIALLLSADRTSHAEQGYAIRSLLASAINDLTTSLHLLTHGYFTQTYGAMRMAYEACDLLELVATDSEQAALWVNTTKGWIDFSPREVRKKLGKDSFDPVYSHLSEHAHPRFAASRLSAFGVAKTGTDAVQEVILRIGPSLIDERPTGWHAAGFLLQTLGLLSIRASHLALHKAVSEEAWDDALDESMAGQQRMAEVIADSLAKFGQDASGIVDLYRENAQRILRGEDPVELPEVEE